MPVDGLPLAVETALMNLLEENNLSSWRIVGGERYAVLTLKFQVAMSEQGERSGHSSVQRVCYRKKPPSQVNKDKLRSQAWKAKSQTMDMKRTSEQTQVIINVSSDCPQLATSTTDNESGAVCLTSTVDTERSVTYIDGSNHLESINKQAKYSDTQSSSSDSDSRESEGEEETYTVHYDDGCQAYLSSKSGTKWWTCTDCDDFDLCI